MANERYVRPFIGWLLAQQTCFIYIYVCVPTIGESRVLERRTLNTHTHKQHEGNTSWNPKIPSQALKNNRLFFSFCSFFYRFVLWFEFWVLQLENKHTENMMFCYKYCVLCYYSSTWLPFLNIILSSARVYVTTHTHANIYIYIYIYMVLYIPIYKLYFYLLSPPLHYTFI